MTSVVINGAMGLAMIIAMLYSATDIDAAIESPTGYPYIEIFHQATGSRGGTAAMTALIIVMTLSAIVGVIAATSRMFWAFARDRGLPFWPTLSKVCFLSSPRTKCGSTYTDYRLTLAPMCLPGPSPSPALSRA
jgi:amino acid transporter